jgi:serine/threonine-protein kinase
MPSLPKLSVGDTFVGEYEVVKVFSDEADRFVAQVKHTPSGRQEALKIIAPADEAALETFVAEMQRAAAVSSKHILSVSAVGVDEASGCPYVVTELLEGDDLATTLKARPTAPMHGWDDAVSQVGQALGAGHAVGISHGHLSPEMVVLAPTETADPFRAVLLDLGLPVAAWSRAHANDLKAAWLPPEMLAGGGPSAAADIYSFGLLAFYLVTGKMYFPKANAATVDAAALAAEAKLGVVEGASARAKTLGINAALPKHFDAFFAKCTAKEPSARFANGNAAWEGASDLLSAANELAGEITDAADDAEDAAILVPAHKPPPLPLMKAIAENPKPAIALAVGLVLVATVIGLGAGSFVGKTQAKTAKSKALEWAAKNADECEKACEGGDASACHGLGLMTASGGKVPQDQKKAAALFDKACKGGDMSGCATLAERYVSGEGVKENLTEAATLYTKACDAGEGGACADLADLHRAGRGVPKNEAQAKIFQDKACKAGIKDACGDAK